MAQNTSVLSLFNNGVMKFQHTRGSINSDTRTPEQLAAVREVVSNPDADVQYFVTNPFAGTETFRCTFLLLWADSDGKVRGARITPKGTVKYVPHNGPAHPASYGEWMKRVSA